MNLDLKNYNTQDTIAAIATFPATAALGVIRVSGKNTFKIISQVFLTKTKKDIRKAKTFSLHYGWIINRAQSTKIIDEVLVSIMRAPNSYTKEDVAEISCHGGVLVLNKVLEIILKKGARLALPGEFTYRAFINGRIGLLEAESILNIVNAKAEQTLPLAAAQLRGKASGKITEIKNTVKQIFVQTEDFINFPEEEIKIDLLGIKKQLKILREKLKNLSQGSEEARILGEGLRCVICGRTNVGKSTLFNYLLREERVIVSKTAGTTRDVIEETINIRGIPLRIYDTAGILEPRDLIDKKAIEKTEEAFSQADLVILVLDGSRPLGKEDIFLFKKLEKINASSGKNKKIIVVINKSDLKQKLSLKDISQIGDFKVKLSALKKKGIEVLEEAVFKTVYKKGINKEDIIFLERTQKTILEKVTENIFRASQFIESGYPLDFLNLSLKEALYDLGRLSGEVFCEEIIESIFSNFCIGK